MSMQVECAHAALPFRGRPVPELSSCEHFSDTTPIVLTLIPLLIYKRGSSAESVGGYPVRKDRKLKLKRDLRGIVQRETRRLIDAEFGRGSQSLNEDVAGRPGMPAMRSCWHAHTLPGGLGAGGEDPQLKWSALLISSYHLRILRKSLFRAIGVDSLLWSK